MIIKNNSIKLKKNINKIKNIINYKNNLSIIFKIL